VHKAEQIRLLIRLAADSGARRGELVALRFADLEGRVLTIERAVSADVLGPTKTGRTRRLTLGRGTAELWRSSAEAWAGRLPDDATLRPWVFSPEASHEVRLRAGALGHWFAELIRAAEVPGASLHRLRHSVATFLVGRSELLRAQQRLELAKNFGLDCVLIIISGAFVTDMENPEDVYVILDVLGEVLDKLDGNSTWQFDFTFNAGEHRFGDDSELNVQTGLIRAYPPGHRKFEMGHAERSTQPHMAAQPLPGRNGGYLEILECEGGVNYPKH